MYFISKNVDRQGRNLFFGDLPDDRFIIIEDDWTIGTILDIIGIKYNAQEVDEKIPRGFSQFKSNDGDFDKNIFILNL